MTTIEPAATPAGREQIVAAGAIEGGNQTLDRLAEYLAKPPLT